MMTTPNTSSGRLKILFLSSDKYPPFRPDVSVLFARELVARGHKIDMVLQSIDACNKDHTQEWSGCRVFVGASFDGSSKISRFIKHFKDVRHDLKTFGVCKKCEYDLIIIKDKFLAALIGELLSKLFNIKYLYWLSYPFPEADFYSVETKRARYPVLYKVRGWVRKQILYKRVIRKADHVFVQSDEMKKHICSMGFSGENMTPVPMGISVDEFDYDQNLLAKLYEKKKRVIVYLGALNKVRRIDFLINAYSEVVKSFPLSELYLVGGSENQNDVMELMVQVNELGLEKKVFFTGFLPRDKALTYLQKAHLCVSPLTPNPILALGTPTKLIEYMAMGKPVVCNDHPDQRLVIEESGGGMCVSYETISFANAMLDIMKNPQMAVKMGTNGRDYVLKHRNYRMISKMLEDKFIEIKNIV